MVSNHLKNVKNVLIVYLSELYSAERKRVCCESIGIIEKVKKLIKQELVTLAVILVFSCLLYFSLLFYRLLNRSYIYRRDEEDIKTIMPPFYLLYPVAIVLSLF